LQRQVETQRRKSVDLALKCDGRRANMIVARRRKGGAGLCDRLSGVGNELSLLSATIEVCDWSRRQVFRLDGKSSPPSSLAPFALILTGDAPAHRRDRSDC
jgi:hypothetical protein